jgi:hypothetical protein
LDEKIDRYEQGLMIAEKDLRDIIESKNWIIIPVAFDMHPSSRQEAYQLRLQGLIFMNISYIILTT